MKTQPIGKNDMKKLIATSILVLASAGAYAGQNNVGCGLGAMVFDGQSGVFPQILAATTNGTSGNQTFGISSGTLGCTQDGTVTSSAKLAMFTGANMDRLAQDMSSGQGESLESMAYLMGIKEQDKAHFFTVAKENFSTIFPSDKTTAEHVLSSLHDVMASDEVLRQYV
jgi:hypothetical protein